MTATGWASSAWSTERVDTILAPFVCAGLLGPFELQLAAAALRAEPSTSDDALLALSLVARATRLGHVCIELDQVTRQVAASQDEDGTREDLDLPATAAWTDDLGRSALVDGPDEALLAPLRPMVWDEGRLYLQRYWAFEKAVADALSSRHRPDTGGESGSVNGEIEDALASVFVSHPGVPDPGVPDPGVPDPGVPDPGVPDGQPDLQLRAARRALAHQVSVIAGGPGTGKTHTVAGILAAAHRLATDRGQVIRAALAAPTGKAAARMQEAVEQRVAALVGEGRVDPAAAEAILAAQPTTIHRLLGSTGRSGFRHGRNNPLPHDLVIIDETSMVSLPLLARLLEALRPTARLVLVGDPFQLSSIEAGTVMADLVGPWGGASEDGSAPLHDRVTELVRGHRFGSDSATAALALAIRKGDGDEVIGILGSGRPDVHWARPADPEEMSAVRAQVVGSARQVVAAAVAGEDLSALEEAVRVKVLTAVRQGPNGLAQWGEWISAGTEDLVPIGQRGGWPPLGMPVMVTGNDPINHLANGDVGIVIQDRDGRWVVMGGPERIRRLAPARLGAWEPWWAMTIHKSQGSEFSHAVVALPTTDSPILTRELLYTAVTRGKPEVTVVGSEEIIRLAVARPVARASGLCDRLWPGS
jgi:exodeoxyribonuclease V alpha subunit